MSGEWGNNKEVDTVPHDTGDPGEYYLSKKHSEVLVEIIAIAIILEKEIVVFSVK